jgi:hypothetical protein
MSTTVRVYKDSVNKNISVRTLGVNPPLNSLGQINEIDITGVANNDVLVYDSVREKFVAKPVPVINGGTF